MVNLPKKQQQCLIPRYLLQYLQDLQISHNDPTAPWGGGGGGSYTAGTGIDITNDVISIDSTVVALKTDLSDYVTSSELITELGNYVTSIDLATELLNYAELDDIPTKTSDLTNDSGFITSSALTGYATESWVNNQGYSTFSGSYNDLTNKPTIPAELSGGTWINIDSNNSINVSNPYISLLDGSGNPRVMISSTSNGTDPTFTATYCNITPTGFGIVDKTQGSFDGYSAAYTYYRHRNILVNNKWTLSFPTDDGTIATQEWVTDKAYATKSWVNNQGYSTFSGSYNDLTNKPTIPSVSGSYSASYWTSITINGTTKSIPSSSDFVNLSISQNITGTKTFVGSQRLNFRQNAGNDILGFTAYDYNNNELGNLQVAKRTVDGSTYPYVTLGNYSPQSTKSKLGFRIQPNGSSNSFNFVMPYGTTTEFTSNTYSTSSDTTIPCAFTDGTTIIKADATGLVNISSISGGGGSGTTVSGTNDGTNWTSLTIGSDTYGIPSGGGGGGSGTSNLFLHNFRMIIATSSTQNTAIEATILTKSSNQILTVAELTSQIAALQATQYDDSVVGVIYGQWYRTSSTTKKEVILGFGLTGTAASPNLYMVVPNGNGASSPINFMSTSTPVQTIQWVNGLTDSSGYEVTAECTDVVTPAIV